MAKILGRFAVLANGKRFDTMKGASLDPGGGVAVTKTSAHKVAGYAEDMRPSRMEFRVPATVDVSASELQQLRDAQMTFESDIGKSWTIPKAWTVEPVRIDDSTGEWTVVMEGEPGEEHG
jgi:hypothetical protein